MVCCSDSEARRTVSMVWLDGAGLSCAVSSGMILGAGLWLAPILDRAGDGLGVMVSNVTLPDLLRGLLDSRGLFLPKQPLHIHALPMSLDDIPVEDSSDFQGFDVSFHFVTVVGWLETKETLQTRGRLKF